MMTKYGIDVSNAMFDNKLDALVNQFFKILPIKESGEPSLQPYMEGLLREMLGMQELIRALEHDAQYMSLLSILQYMVSHDCDVASTKSDVFKAIGIIKKLKTKFANKRGEVRR